MRLEGLCWAKFFAEMPMEGMCWAKFFANQQLWDPVGRTLSRRSPGSRPPLLAVLTLQCAATPDGWHGRQPAQATTHRVNARRMRSQRWGLERSQAPGAFHISGGTTEAGPRRIPPLVACCGRAGPPAPETQRPSLSSETTAAVESGANAQFFHQPLTVSTAWAPRSDSAEWALTRPEDRRAAWKREATFSQFTRFHQALT